MNFTQRMAMHLNGGSKFSELRFEVFADGKPTNITRITRTAGSPKYLKTRDVLVCGDEEFDMLAAPGDQQMNEWLEARVSAAQKEVTMDVNELITRIEGTYGEMPPDLVARVSSWIAVFRTPDAPVVHVPRPGRVPSARDEG